MVEEDKERWLEFTNRPKQNELNKSQIELVAELHAKYYNHKYTRHFYSDQEIDNLYKKWSK